MKKFFLIVVWIFLLFSCTSSNDNDLVNDKNNNLKINKIEKPEISTAFLTWSYNKNFHELDLSNKNLDEIPDFKKYLTWAYKDDVWSIILQNNNIENVDFTRFKFFPNLKEVNLSYNNITEITINHPYLNTLLLHKNKIKNINLEWSNLIQNLNLWYNELESLKDSNLPINIKNIELQHNKLIDLTWIEKLELIEKVKFEFNKLEDDDMFVFKDLKNVINISFGYNQLSEKMEDWFKKYNEGKKEVK